jgi:hypothetical protein
MCLWYEMKFGLGLAKRIWNVMFVAQAEQHASLDKDATPKVHRLSMHTSEQSRKSAITRLT